MSAAVRHIARLDWAPDIPVGWDVVRLRWVSRIFAGGTPDRSNLDFWTDGTIPWLNSGSVNDLVIATPSAFITEAAVAKGATRWAPHGSVLVALAGQGKTKGMAARLEIDSTLNQSMAAIVPGSTIDQRYLHYWLASNYRNLRGLAGGDLRDGLNLQHIGSVQVPRPPLAEQRAIADFLDRETATIDAFIAKNEELITLLTERRRAAIELAVSPSPLPQGWKSCQVRRLGPKSESGVSVNGYSVPADAGEAGVLRTGAVSKGYFDPNDNKRVVEEDLARVATPVRGGTLLVNRANTPELVGQGVYVEESQPNLFLSDKLWQITFESADPAFLHYWTLTSAYRTQLAGLSVGASSSMQNLSYRDFLTVDVSVPSVERQREIVAVLNRGLSQIDEAIETATRAIELARERRAALISAAVTGKVDVGVSV